MNRPVHPPLTVLLSDEQLSQLEQLASERDQTPAQIAQRALADYLAYVADYRGSVQEGLDDVAASRVRSWEAVEADLRSRYGEFDD